MISEMRKRKKKLPVPGQSGEVPLTMPPLDIIYGLHPVATAIACGRRVVRASIALGDPTDARSTLHSLLSPWLSSVSRAQRFPVIRAERGHLDSITRNGVHQGLVGEFEALPALPELPFGLAPGDFPCPAAPAAADPPPPPPPPPPLLVTFDNVTDPQNFGAVLRSALLLGADGIVLARSGGPPLNATVAKASAGALDVWRAHGRLYACSGGFPTWLQGAAAAGWRVLGASAPAARGAAGAAAAAPLPFATLARTEPTILVLGAEGAGLRSSVLAACTHTVCIALHTGMVQAVAARAPLPPPMGLPDSLNVSVAAALLLAKLQPQ